VQAAVLATGIITHVDVAVAAALPSGAAYAWDLTFNHYSAGAVTGQSGDVPPFSLKASKLTGFNAAVVLSTLHNGGDVLSGTFGVTYAGAAAGALAMVPHNATAAALRTALVAQLGLPPATAVTRTGPSTVGEYVWRVTLPGATVLASGSSFTLDSTALSGTAAAATAAVVVPAVQPLGGAFTVAVGASPAVTVAYNATAAALQAALAASAPGVTVSDTAAAAATGSKQWQLTFAPLRYAGGSVLVTPVNTALTGAGIALAASTVAPAVSADVALLTIAPSTSGSFLLLAGFMSVSATVATPAAALSAALSALPGIGSVYVEQTVNAVTGALEWRLLFATAFTSASALTLDTTGLAVPGSVVLTVEHTATAGIAALAGSYALRYSQLCDERASGVWCVPAVTPPLSVASVTAAADATAALEQLPGVLDVTVQAVTAHAVPAYSGFGIASTELRLQVAFNKVRLSILLLLSSLHALL
jgi:hypothetical protein